MVYATRADQLNLPKDAQKKLQHVSLLVCQQSFLLKLFYKKQDQIQICNPNAELSVRFVMDSNCYGQKKMGDNCGSAVSAIIRATLERQSKHNDDALSALVRPLFDLSSNPPSCRYSCLR